jgi:C4-dicarboxylate-binding protein DctP
VVTNRKFWEGLPPDLRGILEACLKEATTYANAIAETENLQALDKMRASGKTSVEPLTPAETEEWKKAMFVVHREMADRVGKDTIRAVYKAAGFVVPA